jgi:hypothetical protein
MEESASTPVASAGSIADSSDVLSTTSAGGGAGAAAAGADATSSSYSGRGVGSDVRPHSVIQEHHVRGDPIPKPLTQPTLAFDRDQAPVLLRHLRSEDDETVRQALISCRTLLSRHKNAAAIQQEAGMIEHLCLIASSHPSIQHSRIALECIQNALNSPSNRTWMISQCSAILRASAESSDTSSRATAYSAMALVGDSIEAAEAAVQEGFVATLVSRLEQEILSYAVRKDLTDLVLAALQKLLRSGAQPPSSALIAALNTTTPAACPLLLDAALNLAHPSQNTVCLALDCIAAISGEFAGKRAVLGVEGSMDGLLTLATSSNNAVASGAVSVLMVRGIQGGESHFKCVASE